VDRRWGNSSNRSRRSFQATWLELGRPEEWVPTVTRDGGGENNTGERREGQTEAQKKSSEGWRASQDQGEAMGGAVVDREGLG
jgi:hypothetical protein